MSLRRDLAVDLASAHPDEAAAVLEAVGAPEAAAFLASLPAEDAGQVLLRTTAHPAGALLAALGGERAADIAAHLPIEVAAGYLRRVDAAVREPILAGLAPRRARALSALLRHREDTAGALMDPEVLALPDDVSVREAVERVRKSAEHARYNIYVVDRDDHLVGVLNLRELLLAKPRQPLSAIMRRDPMRLAAEADWRTVVQHPGWREVHALPVVDADGSYLGALRYRTLRALEGRMRRPVADTAATSRALGDLFWAGLSGVIEALAGAPAQAGRVDGGRRGDE